MDRNEEKSEPFLGSDNPCAEAVHKRIIPNSFKEIS